MTEQLSLFEEQPPSWLSAAIKREGQSMARFDRTSLRHKFETEFMDASPVYFSDYEKKQIRVKTIKETSAPPAKIDRRKAIGLVRLAYVNKKRLSEIIEMIRAAGKNMNMHVTTPVMNLGDALDIGLITKEQYLADEGRYVAKRRVDQIIISAIARREQKKVK